MTFQRWDTSSAYMGEYPIPIRTRPLRKGRRSEHLIVRNAPEKIVGISRKKIAAHYPNVKSLDRANDPMIGRLIRAFGADDVVPLRPKGQKTTISDDR